ncbi:glycosyltransferase family 4 protein [Bradyrhizobium sp. NP1]|uniref:glycosyltransferase family 4 protein n=1 Tax=Bradyrhizobium sp. NP1 TaxID=3049772 RepID=UPI0025A533E6|nr:glycosyltransferase family 4 protein [Bradyrhizobium sp. NP1]WJR77314.1 glycosyltransferase family 4 protein [Bradyrhizobium sp. NP1]
MNVLIAHNFYKHAGGEDQCVAAEVALLRAHGHQVTQYCLSNDAVDGMGRLRLAGRTIWSRQAFATMRSLIATHRPQVVHFHNTFPLISPAAYYAAHAESVPTVQTLHNFRLVCVNALLFRDGKPCEQCLDKTIPWHGVAHSCYRDNRGASAAVAAMLAAHRLLGTWRDAVDAYVALSEFSRRKFIAGGLPADKIAVKFNFTYPEPGPGSGDGGYAVYVGRLSTEKGVQTLLKAWQSLGVTVPLKIAGDGPLAPSVREAVAQNAAIEWLQGIPHERVYELIGAAAFLVLPSQCYEGALPRVVIEAFAKGTPVVVSAHGAMTEIVDGSNGVCFAPGNPEDLAAKVRCLGSDTATLRQMRRGARETFDRNFTAAANHRALLAIYARAIARYAGHGLPETKAVSVA